MDNLRSNPKAARVSKKVHQSVLDLGVDLQVVLDGRRNRDKMDRGPSCAYCIMCRIRGSFIAIESNTDEEGMELETSQ